MTLLMKPVNLGKKSRLRCLIAGPLLIASALAANMEIVRLSDTMIIAQEDRDRTFALNTARGIVVIDTRGSLASMRTAKTLIEAEFKRHDYAFVINTHDHWEHVAGNGVFDRNLIVAHEGFRDGRNQDKPRLQAAFTRIEQNLGKEEKLLAGLEKSSPAFQAATAKIAVLRDAVETIRAGVVEPAVVFSERLTLDLGDRTVKLIFFGKGHSHSDVLVHIPEEKVLLTGGTCSLSELPPPFQAWTGTMDVARWIAVLGEFVDSDQELKYIIPGHAPHLTKADLKFIRDYWQTLWQALNQATKSGWSLEQARERHSLARAFGGFPALANPTAKMIQRHHKNMDAVWASLNRPAGAAASSNPAAEPRSSDPESL